MAKLPKRLTIPYLPCLVCGVDSLPIKIFLGVFIGGLFLASLCLFFWAKGSGRLKSKGNEESLAILAENKEGKYE